MKYAYVSVCALYECISYTAPYIFFSDYWNVILNMCLHIQQEYNITYTHKKDGQFPNAENWRVILSTKALPDVTFSVT